MSNEFNADYYLSKNFYDELSKKEKLIENKDFLQLVKKIKDSNINVILNPTSSEITIDDEAETLIVQNNNFNSNNVFNIHLKSKFANVTVVSINSELSTTYNHYKFHIYNKAKIQFITLPQKNKIKNKIEQFFMNSNTEIENVFYSDISSEQLLDDSIEVFHNYSNTISKTIYNSYTSGKIVTQVNSLIAENSTNSQTEQKIKHVATSEKSTIFSKPNLIIKNPNVIASHGNSIGNISKEELFYLQQRGISENDCKRLLKLSCFNNFFENHYLFSILKEFYLHHEY